MSDDVVRLRVRRKNIDPDRTLEVVPRCRCQHLRFVIDESLDAVECADCGDRLSPMWVLKQLAFKESWLAQRRDFFRKQVAALQERTKFKCGKCGSINDLTRSLRTRTRG